MARGSSAKRHAQAVFQIALENDTVEQWRSELAELVATLSDPRLVAVLENPKVRLADKTELIANSLPGLSELALNFAYLLVARQRLGLLEDVLREYERMADSYEGKEHARVTTAIPLDDEDKGRLSERLADFTGKHVVLATDVDPHIIGGFVARIGDRLIDGSTRAKLEALRKRLVETTG